MRTLSSSLLFCLVAILLVAGSLVSAQGPAYVFMNTDKAATGMTLQAGSPFLGIADTAAYIIGSIEDVNAKNTSICVFDAIVNGSCVDRIITSPTMDAHTEEVLQANYNGAFLLTIRNTVTEEVSTYRWDSYYGIDWKVDRGILAPRGTQLVEKADNADYLVTATPAGTMEMILGSFTSGHSHHANTQSFIPIPAAHVRPNTAYARDLTWLVGGSHPSFAAISLGRVYSFDATDGSTIASIETPCGYNSTEFHMKQVLAAKGEFQLLVYGNAYGQGVNNSDVFVICSLAMNASLTQLWSSVVDFTITPANGDDSVITLRTAYINNLWPVATDHIFISGQKGNNNKYNYLFCWNIQNQSFVWEQMRLQTERFNMPVFVEGPNDVHIAFTLQGSLVGFDPVNQNIKWDCSQQHLGCAGTPALQRLSSGAIARAVCVSAEDPMKVVAIDVGTSTSHCELAWTEKLPQTAAVTQQNIPAQATTSNGELEPFVAVLATDGSLWSLSYRSTSDPVPTPAPTNAPTPGPTLPPGEFPEPLYSTHTPPLSIFDTVQLMHPPVFSPFSYDGPIMAAVAAVTLRDEQYQKEKNVGLGNTYMVLYYESIPIVDFKSFDYNYVKISPSYRLTDPLLAYYSDEKFVTASYEEIGTGDLHILYTIPGTKGGYRDTYGRYGADEGITTNGMGSIVYSVGVLKDDTEYVKCLFQQGSGNGTALRWQRDLHPSDNTTFKALSTHVGPITFASVHGQDFYLFSYRNSLYIVNGTDGTDVMTPITNPGGLMPSRNPFTEYYPMYSYWMHSATENLFIVIVETWQQYGEYSWGIQAVDMSSGVPDLAKWNFILKNTTYISNIQTVGNANVFAMDCYDTSSLGTLVGFDAKMGRQLWSVRRDTAYGHLIVPVAGTNNLVTNMDRTTSTSEELDTEAINTDMLISIVDATSGKVLGSCDFALEYYAVVSSYGSAESPVIVGNLYGDNGAWSTYVRAIQFQLNSGTGKYTCKTLWQYHVGSPVHGVSSGEFAYSAGSNRYVEVMTQDGYIYSLSPQAGAIPTPAPPLPPTATSSAYMTTQLDANTYQTPFSITPTFAPLIMGDFAKIGNVGFAAVDAGVKTTSAENDDKNKKTEETIAVAGAEENIEAAYPRYTALVAYEAVSNFGKYHSEAIPPPNQVLLDYRTLVNAPVSLFNNFGFPGESEPQVAAVAYTTRSGDGTLIALMYPADTNTKSYQIPRIGAYAKAASDGNGRIFFSIGFNGTHETFVCYRMGALGNNFTLQWSYRLPHPPGFNNVNKTSHVGDAEWIFDSNTKGGYVSFSFFASQYTLDAITGDLVSSTFHPCGFASPDSDDLQGAPLPMYPYHMELMNHTARQVVLSNDAGVNTGNYGICGLTADGKTALWKIEVDGMNSFNGVVPMFYSNHILFSGVSIATGGGLLIGVNAATGASWTATRKNAISTMPAPIPMTSTDDHYFVANMDSQDPDQDTAYYLSVGDLNTGSTVAQCNYACAISPIRTFTMDASGKVTHYFVCTLKDYPTVLRATLFTPTGATTGNNRFSCSTYFDVTLPEAAQAVWLNDHTYISVGLVSGGLSTVSMTAGGSPNNNNDKGGLSAGGAAALAICMIIAFSFIGFVVYYLKFRNVKRSAISEAQRGLEYSSGTGSANVQTGYGSTAGDV